MTTPTITVPLLRRHLNAAYLRRGKRLFEAGAILHYDLVHPRLLRGAVLEGEGEETAEVTVHFGREAIQGDCSCTVGFNCPHVAALLYRLRAEQEQRHEDAPTRTEDPFGRWLNRLDRGDARAMADENLYAPGIRQRLIYLIRPDEEGRPLLHLRATQQRDGGGYGMLNRFPPDRVIAARPNFALAVDIELAQRIIDLREKPLDHHVPLTGSAAAALLEAAIATGRCHYLDHNRPALAAGEERKGLWCWRRDQAGNQRLTLQVGEEFPPLLPLTPPWYIDAEAHRCGPVACPMAERAADLLQLPQISVERQEESITRLRAVLPEGIPQPEPVPVEQRMVTPTPLLRLYTLPASPATGNRPLTGAEFFFDYEGHLVHSDSEERLLTWQEGELLVRAERDRGEELRCRSLLVRFGLSHMPVDPHQRRQRIPEWVAISDEQWFGFVTDCVPQLRAQGFVVEIEESFRFRAMEVTDWHFAIEGEGVSGRATLTASTDSREQLDLIEAVSGWLHENPEYLTDEAIEGLTRQKKIHLPLPGGRWLAIPTGILQSMLRHLVDLFTGHETVPATQWVALGRALEQRPDVRFQQNDEWLEQMRRLTESDAIPAAVVPQGLRATLREYQIEGLNWLQFLRQLGLGGILADDMGLGKTVQTLAHILLEKEEGRLDLPALVVAPTSLMHNWKAEAARFTPDLSVLVLHGPNRKEAFDRIGDHDLVLTTYPLLPRDREAICAFRYHLLILDEAQQVKNPRSKAAQIVRTIDARHRLCLTGTPLENHLGELWTQFDFLMPGYLFGQQSFTRHFRRPIEQEGSQLRREQLNLRIRPFMLRRAKSDVVRELPPKTEIVRCVTMEEQQQRLYESVRLSMEQKVRESLAAVGLGRSRMVVLDALLRMRQVCCDPRLLRLRQDPPPPSAKMELLCDMLPEMVSEGRRILLFSQFTKMLRLIEEACRSLGIPYSKLTGNTRDRITPIERFQQGKVPLFLISLKAGGTGLNLTAADTVIHYDPWWNPAVEDQASDRAHRIGQEKAVFVYKLITAGTVEERILEMQARKRQLAEGIHDATRGKQPLWSEAELESLFAPIR
ncbi:MAG: DEAD/DEAH box helicase [Zetaproteobacteria bacterium]|nr:MAG: DEAD/DEAH box helicase [Zetaproteobacteria bacterium]